MRIAMRGKACSVTCLWRYGALANPPMPLGLKEPADLVLPLTILQLKQHAKEIDMSPRNCLTALTGFGRLRNSSQLVIIQNFVLARLRLQPSKSLDVYGTRTLPQQAKLQGHAGAAS